MLLTLLLIAGCSKESTTKYFICEMDSTLTSKTVGKDDEEIENSTQQMEIEINIENKVLKIGGEIFCEKDKLTISEDEVYCFKGNEDPLQVFNNFTINRHNLYATRQIWTYYKIGEEIFNNNNKYKGNCSEYDKSSRVF